MPYTTPDQALAMSRYWWGRYLRLPQWRWWARKKALAESRYWGDVAIKANESE